MKKILLLLLSNAILFTLYAQVGSLDPAFGTNGIRLHTSVPNVSGSVIKVLPAPGNYQYVVYYTDLYGYPAITIAKFSGDGTLQAGYGIAGFSEPLVMQFTDAVLQEDGKVVVAGSTADTYYGDFHDDLLVARFTTDGVQDASFSNGGIFIKTYTAFSYEFTQSVTISNNRLAVQGYSVSLVGQFAFFHTDVFDLDGNNTATIFLGNLIDDLQQFYPVDYNYSVALQSEKLLVAAVVPDFSGSGNFFSLQRFLADGSPDMGFGIDGTTTLGTNFFNGPVVIATQGDKLVAASYSYQAASGNYGFAVARYNNDGLFDNSFNGNGMQVIDFGEPVPVMPRILISRGDTVYVGGDKYNPQTQKMEYAIARFRNDGLLDAGFDGDGKQVTGVPDYSLSMKSMAVYGNRLAVAGLSRSASSAYVGVMALYLLEDNSIQLTCPANTTVNTDPGLCTAIVNGIAPLINGVENSTNISYSLTGATTGAGQGSVNGMAFNKGTTIVTYTVISDPSKTCSFQVIVFDREAPVITRLTATPATLWPPNHKMKDVKINYRVTDNCGPVTTVVSVSSNEAEEKTEAGDVPGDWVIRDAYHIQLRAERAGKGNGRIYTIRVIVADASGNKDTAEVMVTVPHSNSVRPDAEAGETNQLNVSAFPNPSRNYFTLQTSAGANKKLTLRVTNQLGIAVETKTGLPANGVLQIGQNYPAGIYLAEIRQGEERKIIRLVKLK